jgi:acyl-CoA thioesterase-2
MHHISQDFFLNVIHQAAVRENGPVQPAVDELIALLDLEELEVNIFRGVSPDLSRQRVFGGQVAGQALIAAARTVDDESAIHSLHAYFLRPGDPARPILYDVDRIRDGRSFTTRRVVAIQQGKAIFHLQASFHGPEESFDHQHPMPADVPDPDSLPTFRERLADFKDMLGAEYDRDRAIDIRPCEWLPADRKRELPPYQNVWFRADGTLPDDPVLHACIATYASDMTLLDTATLPHALGATEENLFMASLDHAMWFHRPFRADEWLLYAQDSPSASGALGLTRGLIYTRGGDLAMSVVQEGLLRVLR